MSKQVLGIAISEDGHAVSRIVGSSSINQLQLSDECYKILISLEGALLTTNQRK